MTLLILADAARDATAVRLAVLANQSASATLIAPVELALAEHWVHRVQGRAVSTSFTTRNGVTIDSASVVGVFNRLWVVPVSPLTQFRAVDRDYAQAELHALAVSWLAGLHCPVVNAASPHALCSSPLTMLRWQILAHRAGLKTIAARLTTSQRRFPAPDMMRAIGDSSDRAPDPLHSVGPATFTEPTGTRQISVLVIGDVAWVEGIERDGVTSLLEESCVRFARSAQVVLVRVHFVSSADEREWLFVQADTTPDVIVPEHLAALLSTLCKRRPAFATEHSVRASSV
ncbi:MAG: hypothetical protein ABJB66_10705 [Gemmatimonadaceae bacterium]